VFTPASPSLVPLFWFVVAAQCLGILAAWFTRQSEGSRLQRACQLAFIASLLLVGLATIAALRLGAGYWLCCGATFSLMVLVTVCEFAQPAEGTESPDSAVSTSFLSRESWSRARS